MLSIQRRIGCHVLWPRLAGLIVLLILLWRIDTGEVWQAWRAAHKGLLLFAVSLNFLLLFIKTLRWQVILRAQHICYPLRDAYVVFWSSIFIGAVTPGRLGEFVRAAYLNQERQVPAGRAVSSVLIDRLFDLLALTLVGCVALAQLGFGTNTAYWLAVIGLAAVLMALSLLLHQATFNRVQKVGMRLGKIGQWMFGNQGWIVDLRQSIVEIAGLSLVLAACLTGVAYAVFFGQCYLLAMAVDLSADFSSTTYAVALGSLVALVPVSIAGLGTREAAIIAYLGTVDISSEAALSFSLLVFTTFHLAGGLIGAAARWIKPLGTDSLKDTA